MEIKYQTQEAIEAFCRTFQSLKSRKNIRYADLCDGFIFVQILKAAPVINISTQQLDESEGKWILKLGNLKKIITRLQHYCSQKLNKTLLSKDIDLIQISKNHSPEEIVKFFQLIIATLMESPFKQDYIEKIMSLDQKSQQIFVNIIRNALDCRITLSAKHEALKYGDQIKVLKQQNQHLREEMQFFLKTNKNLSKQLEQFKQKVKEQSEQIESMKQAQKQKTNESLTLQLTQQRNLTQNLKNKLINIARQHQTEIGKYQQQINIYEIKLQHLQQIENNLEMYKERYTDALRESYRKDQIEKEKRKLMKQIEDKDATIKSLNDKIEEFEVKRQNMEENQLYMKMELEKKEVRFKLLEKEVKTKLHSNNLHQNKICNSPNLPPTILEQSLDDQRLERYVEQIDFLKIEINKLRNSNQLLERQNMKHKKKLQKLNDLQTDKKKLQKMIVDVSKSRDAEIQMLVVSMWELRNQNVKIFELLKESNEDYR